jgi:hypothetical protein
MRDNQRPSPEIVKRSGKKHLPLAPCFYTVVCMEAAPSPDAAAGSVPVIMIDDDRKLCRLVTDYAKRCFQ